MKNKYLRWIVLRMIIPITWFASSVFYTSRQVNSEWIEFLLGAAVLIGYAIAIDFPPKDTVNTSPHAKPPV